MLNLALFVAKFFFLFLIYLFLFLLVRMVYKDIAALTASSSSAQIEMAPVRPRLVVLQAPHGEAGTTYPLDKRSVIGRSSQNEVQLDDSYVSTNHARILKKNNQFFLEDLGSTNGTYLEGHKIDSPSPLRVGSKIKIGRTLLEFLQ